MQQILQQSAGAGRGRRVSACILIFTSLPKIPLLAIGVGCIGLAVDAHAQTNRRESQAVDKAKADQAAPTKPRRRADRGFLAIDPMEIEIGVGLIRLAESEIRRRFAAADHGSAAASGRRHRHHPAEGPHSRQHPPRRDMNTASRSPTTPLPTAKSIPGKLLAIDSGMTTGKIAGIETRDPAFQQPAVWIEPGHAERAEMLGYTPVEPTAVLATHLQEIVRRHADELLTRDATKHLLDELKKTARPSSMS